MMLLNRIPCAPAIQGYCSSGQLEIIGHIRDHLLSEGYGALARLAEAHGAEAIALYADDPASMRFNCSFLGGVTRFTVEGSTISGTDAQGNEVFRHGYTRMDVENENGFIFYQSDDADAGQFAYFAFSPDTMATTWHLEFRYSNKLEDLHSWFEGAYAYWNASAIATDYTDDEMRSAIQLFASENLSGGE